MEKELTPSQHIKIEELLNSAITNKQHPHPLDLWRAAIVLNSVAVQGYQLYDSDVHDICKRNGYSDTMKEILGHMINAYNDLAHGKKEPNKDYYTFKG